MGQPLITSDMNETRRGIQKSKRDEWIDGWMIDLDISETSSYTNASALLADILNDYDIRLRPGFGGISL